MKKETYSKRKLYSSSILIQVPWNRNIHDTTQIKGKEPNVNHRNICQMSRPKIHVARENEVKFKTRQKDSLLERKNNKKW